MKHNQEISNTIAVDVAGNISVAVVLVKPNLARDTCKVVLADEVEGLISCFIQVGIDSGQRYAVALCP